MANTTLKEKNEVGRLTPPDFKTYSLATVIKTSVLLERKRLTRSMEQNEDHRLT